MEAIAGDSKPAHTLYGEGGAAGQSRILSIDIDITDTPAEAVTIELECAFDEEAWSVFDAGDRFALLDAADKATYTPNALRSALQSLRADGGFEVLSSSMVTRELTPTRVYTAPREVDTATCVITPAESVDIMRHEIESIKIECLVNAIQPRRERLSVTVKPEISDFGGQVEELLETEYMLDAESRAHFTHVMSFSTGQYTLAQFSRSEVDPSIFYRDGAFRASNTDVVEALTRKAAKIALERAHCVQLTVETSVEEILHLDLRDRVRIVDARLPGGLAVGKIIGWDVTFGASQAGQIVVMCPISRSTANEASVDFFDPEIEGSVNIDTTSTMRAVRDGDSLHLITDLTLTDTAEQQYAQIGDTDEHNVIQDPTSQMARTGVTMQFADLTPVEADALDTTVIKLKKYTLKLPEGITL